MTDTLVGDIAAIKDEVGDIPLVIVMSGITRKYFGRDFQRTLDYVTLMRGQLSTKVTALDGDPFLIVPSARLKSEYDFYDGISAGQEAGGAVAASGAEDMKWMIIPITGPMAVGKIDKMRAFSPEEYQAMNAWKVDYRLYHDLWMPPKAYANTFIRTGDLTTAE